ncbi:polysaccharide biosynthesis C-terminal domain-containing protein [Fodinisporobacter ferrooxydans]|uniref:Polysaccharide biosynthesis C-terminal domain-containing protein n=1 Tax=Fodinisporobacter ferrooxydans TaxID=2901836 RepID=A0ABY4CP65_9BACL|nr:polysaccharide biosynthesis C-terminal domain-containing protein [Alicyclobacillaceae bacterium MYW30-H2]
MNTTKKRIFFTFANKIALSVLGLVSSVLIARYLGVDQRGVYNDATVYASVYAAFFGGFGSFVPYAITRLKLKVNSVQTVANFFLACVSILTVLCLPVGFMLHKISLEYQVLSIPYLLIAAPFIMGFGFFSRLLQGLNEIEKLNKANIAQNIAFLVLTAFAFFFMRNHSDYYKLNLILALWAISNVISFFYSVYLSRRACDITLAAKWDGETGRQMLGFGSNIAVGNLIERVNYRADYFMVDLLHRQKSIYGISVTASEVMNFVAGTVTSVIYTKISGAEAVESQQVTARVFRITAIVSLLIGICGVLLSGLIPIVYSRKYAGAVAPFTILVFGVALYGLNTIFTTYFTNQLSKPRIAIYLDMTAIVVNVAACYLLIPRLDLIGAAIGSFLGYGSECLLAMFLFLKSSNMRFVDLVWMSKEDWNLIFRMTQRRKSKDR